MIPNSNLLCLVVQNEWNPVNKLGNIFLMLIYKAFHFQFSVDVGVVDVDVCKILAMVFWRSNLVS